MNFIMNFIFVCIFILNTLTNSYNIDYFNTNKIIDNIVLYNNINFSIYSNISYYKVFNYSINDNNFITGNLYYTNSIQLDSFIKIITNNYIITHSNLNINISKIINLDINNYDLLKENFNYNFNNDIYNYIFFSKNSFLNFDISILSIHNFFDPVLLLKQTKCNNIKFLRTSHDNCFDSYKSIVLEDIPQKFNIHNHFIKTSFDFASGYSLLLIH
jgi:hypothetical protein